MSSFSPKRFVPLARFAKIHGRGSTPVLKFHSFSTNLSPIQNLKEFYFVNEDAKLLMESKIPLKVLRPHGGTWLQAPSLLLELEREIDLPKVPFCLGVTRESLPQLNSERAEVYLWDLLGREIFNESGTSFGRVEGVNQNSAGGCFVDSSKGFSFPLEWMDFDTSKKNNFEKIIVPQIEMWSLNPKESPDEGPA